MKLSPHARGIHAELRCARCGAQPTCITELKAHPGFLFCNECAVATLKELYPRLFADAIKTYNKIKQNK